jgi:hypothetical protein
MGCSKKREGAIKKVSGMGTVLLGRSNAQQLIEAVLLGVDLAARNGLDHAAVFDNVVAIR